MNSPNESAAGRPSFFPPILFAVMTVLLAVTTSATVVLTILYFSPREIANADGTKKGSPREPADDQPLVQKGEVKAEEAASASVFYPVPYGSPPNLALTTKSGSRKFLVTRQDELGFTWSMALTVGEVKGLGDVLKKPDGKAPEQKPDPGPHEFAWVAKGLPEKAGSPYSKPHEQKGSFTAPWGQEGDVYFSAPYATPPNVTFGPNTSNASIQTVSPLGFSWKNAGASPLPAPSVPWTAVGVKATAEQITSLAKNAKPLKARENPLKLVDQTGTFTGAVKKKGEVYFPIPYASPPNLVVSGAIINSNNSYPTIVIISEVTPTGFKWDGLAGASPPESALQTWTAKGILATSVPGGKSGK
jgi:hypothetical protein